MASTAGVWVHIDAVGRISLLQCQNNCRGISQAGQFSQRTRLTSAHHADDCRAVVYVEVNANMQLFARLDDFVSVVLSSTEVRIDTARRQIDELTFKVG